MNVPPKGTAPTALEQQVAILMANVERLAGERRDADAQRLFREAEAILPHHPLVLHEHARRLMVGGDSSAARAILERLVQIHPRHLPFWLSLAAVLRTLALREDELAALERALAIDPTHLVVMLQKAAVLDLLKKPRAAASVYGNALQTLVPGTRLPPPVKSHVAHARMRVTENAEALAALMDERLAALSHGDNSSAVRMRFDRCLDRMLGRRRIYTPEPTSMLFPYLQNYEYFAREHFPWLESVEAATGAIREELLGVLGADRAGIKPYIAYHEGLPLNQWHELNNSRRWGAYFLWNEGRREDSHIARCPRTMATLAAVP
jgi:aspartate beta-hydroxylase